MNQKTKKIASIIAAATLSSILALALAGCGQDKESSIEQGSPENTNAVTSVTNQKEDKSFDASKYIGDDGVIKIAAYVDLDGDQLAELFEKANYTERNETLAQWDLMSNNKITTVTFTSANDPDYDEQRATGWSMSSAERVIGQPSLGNRDEACEYGIDIIDRIEDIKTDPTITMKWWAQTEPDQLGFRCFAACLVDPDGNEILMTGADDGGTEICLYNSASLDGETQLTYLDDLTPASADEIADALATVVHYGCAWHVEKF